jgi:hypothetical protein
MRSIRLLVRFRNSGQRARASPPSKNAASLYSVGGGRSPGLDKLASIAPGRGAEAAKLLAAARTVPLPAADRILEGELLITHDRSGRVVDVEAVATKQASPALIASVRNVTLPVTMSPT